MLKKEMYEKLDEYASENPIFILHHIYSVVSKGDNDIASIRSLNVLGLDATMDNLENLSNMFLNYFKEYNTNRFLKEVETPFTLNETVKLLDKHGELLENQMLDYPYTNIEKWIEDTGYNSDMVYSVLLERIRYRAGIMSDIKEVFFPYTPFAFSSTLDDLKKEIKSLPNYEKQKEKQKELSDQMFENKMKNIKVPF